MTDTSTIEQQARESLAVLGLAFRINDGQKIDADTWRELDLLAHHVIECVTFREPARTGPIYPWLRIDKLGGNPDPVGWIETRATEPVYWISKLHLTRLHELEDLLTDLADCRLAEARMQANRAGTSKTVSIEDVIKSLGLDK